MALIGESVGLNGIVDVFEAHDASYLLLGVAGLSGVAVHIEVGVPVLVEGGIELEGYGEEKKPRQLDVVCEFDKMNSPPLSIGGPF